jgi:hypothetical protein
MRSRLVAPVTRGLLGLPPLFLTTQTDTFFAWTIAVPMTAAALGSNYWASAALAIFAARKRIWAQGRISISVALAFAPLTTAATFIHLDEFHLANPIGIFWVIAYGVYPPMLVFLLVRQLRVEGEDPPRELPLPAWIRLILAVQAVVMTPLGVLMFAAPGLASPWWPWSLSALTSQALGAWVLAFGILAAHAVVENDLERVDVALFAYPVLAILHTTSVIRFSGDIQWSEPGAYVYVAFIAMWFVLGAWGFVATRRRGFSEWVEPEPDESQSFTG